MRPALIYTAVLGLVGVLLLLLLRGGSPSGPAGNATEESGRRSSLLPPPPLPSGPAARAEPAPIEPSDLADLLNAPQGSAQDDVGIVATVIEVFRSNFAREGNPVGSNAEITAALTGRNRLKLALIPPDHPAINSRGELCDRWGTPFFFHAESALRMEIRSAGPDRRHWTDDDIVRQP